MSRKDLNSEQKDDFLTALLKYIKKLFSSNSQRGIGQGLESANERLQHGKMDNEVAKELIANHNTILGMTKTFVEDNESQIKSLLDANKLSDVKAMIKENLIGNIDTYFSSQDVSEDALSHPLRRVDAFRHEIIDNINSVFESEFDGVEDILSQVSDVFDKTMSEPCHSHNEVLKESPRMERSKEISKETEMEMTAKSPSLSMSE